MGTVREDATPGADDSAAGSGMLIWQMTVRRGFFGYIDILFT
jgi:hypothetical protein